MTVSGRFVALIALGIVQLVLFGADERSSADVAACDSLALARTVVAMPGPIETLDDWRRLGEALPGGWRGAVEHAARAFIHARGNQDEVPSPTFTLVQVYDAGSTAIWHSRPRAAGMAGLAAILATLTESPYTRP